MRAPLVSLVVAAALASAGCGSMSAGELPPPAGPAGPPAPVLDGAAELVVEPRSRELVLREPGGGDEIARVPAGVGPTNVVSDGDRLAWVVDTGGDGLLVVHVTEDDLEIDRRAYLPGRPTEIVRDPERFRLYVTLTESSRVAELPAHGRPHVLATRPAP